MSTIEQIVTKGAAANTVKKRSSESFLSRFLKLLCSVRFGVTLIVLLGLACFLGMIVMQQSVDGFSRYFEQLTPAQRLVYGKLGIFDIYHSWYFNTLLAVLSLEHHIGFDRPVSEDVAKLLHETKDQRSGPLAIRPTTVRDT